MMTIVQLIQFLRDNGLDVILLGLIDKLLTVLSRNFDRLREKVEERLERSKEKRAAEKAG